MRSLDHCLLGLIEQGDCSGYDIRKILTQTPMRRFSDSPGSIYPALERLLRRGLIRASRDRTSRRGRRVYALTARGRQALDEWLSAMPNEKALASSVDDVMLQLAFQHLLGERFQAARFLAALADAARRHADHVAAYLRTSTEGYPLSALLALRAGYVHYEGLSLWAAREAARSKRRAKTSQRRKS